jgi:transposase
VLNGILWILRTGAPWADLPTRYPSHQTCRRRFQRRVRAGVLRTVLEILAQALHDEGYLNLQQSTRWLVLTPRAAAFEAARFPPATSR